MIKIKLLHLSVTPQETLELNVKKQFRLKKSDHYESENSNSKCAYSTVILLYWAFKMQYGYFS